MKKALLLIIGLILLGFCYFVAASVQEKFEFVDSTIIQQNQNTSQQKNNKIESHIEEIVKRHKSQISELDSSKIRAVFVAFQQAMISNNCQKIIELSNFPIEGDMGLARLIKSDKPRKQMEKYNYQITKELLIQNCSFLDSVEIEVLNQFEFNYGKQNKGVKYDDCIYKSHIYVATDKSYFKWTVGCEELINHPVGEYSMIFTFKLIEGEYKLKQIHGAG